MGLDKILLAQTYLEKRSDLIENQLVVMKATDSKSESDSWTCDKCPYKASDIYHIIRHNNTVHLKALYLIGISFHDLEAILDYIYLGKADVQKERLRLSDAKAFQIDGISEDESIEDHEVNTSYESNISAPDVFNWNIVPKFDYLRKRSS